MTYSYDNDGRPTQIAQGTSTVVLTYDTDGRRTSLTLPNGVVVDYNYDIASQLTGISYQAGATTLGDLSYGYDLAGRRVSTTGSFARTELPNAVSTAGHSGHQYCPQPVR